MGNIKFKVFIAFLIYLLIILVVCLFLFFKNLGTENIKNTFTSELMIYDLGVEYEIKVDNQTGETIFRNGEVEEVIYIRKRTPNPRISIPNLNNIEAQNVLEGLSTIVDFTYNVDFKDSCKYLKYLILEGYELKRYVSTSQYFECYLQKDKVIKRIIIFSDSIMVCDLLEGIEIPNFYNYLKNYNWDGYFENKFNFSYE